MSRLTRLTVAFIAVSLVSLALGVAGTSLIKSPEQVAAEASPPPLTLLTALVTKGTVDETVLLSGKLTPGRVVNFTPAAPAGMDAVVTALPVHVGAKVGPGSLLLAVSDRPLILLFGDIPLTRDLARGDVGPDVGRLQDALRGAGLTVTDKQQVFGRSTQRALVALYASIGYTAPGGNQATALRSELAVVPAGDFGRVATLGVTLGGPITTPAIGITATSSVVSADVSDLDAKRLSVGLVVTLSGAGLTAPVPGKILSIGTLAKNESGGLSVPVTAAPDEPFPTDLTEGVPLQISSDFSTDDEPGLLVPLSGIYSGANGTTSVFVVTQGVKTRVAVQVVASGDGMAKIAVKNDAVKVGDDIYVGVR